MYALAKKVDQHAPSATYDSPAAFVAAAALADWSAAKRYRWNTC